MTDPLMDPMTRIAIYAAIGFVIALWKCREVLRAMYDLWKRGVPIPWPWEKD